MARGNEKYVDMATGEYLMVSLAPESVCVYFKNVRGVLHRRGNAPAFVLFELNRTGPTLESYCLDGSYKRDDGPAWVNHDLPDENQYWLNGHEITKEEYERATRKP